ncbi:MULTISPECIES: (Fe-S)-binding protein [Oceanobacillus]|uniref:Glycolate oxidase iron-sulfur subunit n=1 Tax=Oceanobacillus kimchii TaxID=746691 RepID=A0ABQ5TL00_9BACI|nr:(Fe-S)-binding protein [Oceanobacillus kimchii]MBT2600458.1 (Fe-S)-binding protein [Oceanobacillus sp. ISL-74]MBT2650616.1 (Fe-S)-binding protein [Oceanobacillus sp. ISL-73]GLO67509.1 glycolate oxidase iron-sulfur subunit [Oceanobacillus kimchii]
MDTLVKERIQVDFQNRMDRDELENCMRCGFCLPVCPTYIQSGYDETQSPRGRIALMKGIVDGEIEPDEDIEQTLNECLGCRACEPACPAGVNYGQLLEEARDIFNQNKQHSLPEKVIRKTVFEGLFPHQNRMENMTSLLTFYQRSGLQKIARNIGFMKLFPDTLATMEKVLPSTPSRKEMRSQVSYYVHKSQPKATVAFFKGCLMDTMFREVNKATIELLQKVGCDIAVPDTQNCCGALHGHSGEKEKAKELAKKNIAAFEEVGADYIITNAGGCGAFLHDYGHLLHDDPEWSERAANFASKIKDITAILIDLDFHLTPLQMPEQVVTYQDSCHLRNVQKTFDEPRLLLQSIDGLHYEEMNDAARCCGSAGIYNIVHSELSMKHLDYKMEQVKDTAATTIVTTNPGCLLQMKLGIEREGLSDKMRAVHIVELLIEAVDRRTSV